MNRRFSLPATDERTAVFSRPVPEDYEERLTEMFPGAYEHLRSCARDPYDLALSKLERNIQRDRDDVKHPLNASRST
jgi:hypothetical protein